MPVFQVVLHNKHAGKLILQLPKGLGMQIERGWENDRLRQEQYHCTCFYPVVIKALTRHKHISLYNHEAHPVRLNICSLH